VQGKGTASTVGERNEPLFPRLVARRNASPGAVADHQRARLRAAMIEACARHGYPATTVRELVGLAGVSPNTIYKHFGGKEDCFLSTFEFVAGRATERISRAHEASQADGEEWSAALGRAFDAFVDELVLRPKASRLAVVEILRVGPAAVERIEGAERSFARMIAASLARGPGPRLSPLLVRGFVGGIWFVTRHRLLEQRPSALSDCGQELLRWIEAYSSTEAAKLGCARSVGNPAVGSGSFDRFSADPRARMMRAAAHLAAARGFSSLSDSAIAERAEVDPQEFAAQFAGPADCFFASLELLTAQMLSRALRDGEEAPSWGAALSDALRSLLGQLAADPLLARVTFVASGEAGEEGGEHCAALIEGFAGAFLRRAPRGRRPSQLVAEATAGAIWSVLARYIGRGRADLLPALHPYIAYLALAPVLTGDVAVDVIRAGPTARSAAVN
jgi:AcrR family transcriptional regulator